MNQGYDNYGQYSQEENKRAEDHGREENFQNQFVSAKYGNLNEDGAIDKGQPNKKGITIVENKKRRTDDGLGQDGILGSNTELGVDTDEDEVMLMENTGNLHSKETEISKNGKEAGSKSGVRLPL